MLDAVLLDAVFNLSFVIFVVNDEKSKSLVEKSLYMFIDLDFFSFDLTSKQDAFLLFINEANAV